MTAIAMLLKNKNPLKCGITVIRVIIPMVSGERGNLYCPHQANRVFGHRQLKEN